MHDVISVDPVTFDITKEIFAVLTMGKHCCVFGCSANSDKGATKK